MTEQITVGNFLFSTINGVLASVLLAASMRAAEAQPVEGRLDMGKDMAIIPVDELPSSGVLLQGTKKTELAYALNLMDSVTTAGDKVELSIVSTKVPSETDLANFVIRAAHAGVEVSFPSIEDIDGMPTTTFILTKGETGAPGTTGAFPIAAIIGILPVALITGLIGFGLFKIESITKALMPILLVSFGGLIILVGLLSRKHVVKAAGEVVKARYQTQNELPREWTFPKDEPEPHGEVGPGMLPATRRPTRDEVEIGTWKERDRLGIWVTDKPSGKTIAEWWDDDARQMFEDGFFKPGVPERMHEKPSHEFTESVLEYLEDIGVLQNEGEKYGFEKYLPFVGLEGNELVWKGTFPDQIIKVTVKDFYDKPKTILQSSFLRSKAIVRNIDTDHDLPFAGANNEGSIWWLGTIKDRTIEVQAIDVENLNELALIDIFKDSTARISTPENVQLQKTMMSTWQSRCQPHYLMANRTILQDILDEPVLEETKISSLPQTEEKTWKDFYKGNRIQACIDSYNNRIKTRNLSEAKQRELHESLKTDLADLVEYQNLQALGFASGLLTQEEATQLYQIYGGEVPSPEKWGKLTLAEKIVATQMADELLGLRLKKRMPQTAEAESEEVEMFCQACGEKIPSPSSFRTPDNMRVYFITGLCQACQDKRHIINGLEQSMQEEQKAVDTYSGQMKRAKGAGDNKTADVYEHVISEEIEHKREFGNRKDELLLQFHADSKEYLSQTINISGWRQRLDKEFQSAVARVRK